MLETVRRVRGRRAMTGLNIYGEWLFLGGIAVMGIAAAAGILCLVIFRITGCRLKKKLEKEYGNPLV